MGMVHTQKMREKKQFEVVVVTDELEEQVDNFHIINANKLIEINEINDLINLWSIDAC